MYAYELQVELLKVENPSVWRRISVPGTVSMKTLHRVIQTAFGWRDYHCWNFMTDAGNFCVSEYPDKDADWLPPEVERADAVTVTVADFFTRCTDKKRATYEYDFGDGWEHLLTLKRRRRCTAEQFGFDVLDGAGRCPPEDVGGVHGYGEFKRLLATPDKNLSDHEKTRKEELRVWYGLKKGQTFESEYWNSYDTQTRLYKLQHYQEDPHCW